MSGGRKISIWFGLNWFGLVWYGLVWYDLFWDGLICVRTCLKRMSAGTVMNERKTF
jgi:hypothetical protein